MGYLYRITAPSGKAYIGITVQPVGVRWRAHRNDARRGAKDGCIALVRALRKYGADNFRWEVLAQVEDAELVALEQSAIAAFRTLDPYGYNLTGGGRGCLYLGQESRERISESLRRRWANPEQRRILTQAKVGRPRPDLRERMLKTRGVKRSPEWVANMTAAQRARRLRERSA